MSLDELLDLIETVYSDELGEPNLTTEEQMILSGARDVKRDIEVFRALSSKLTGHEEG